MFNNPRIFRHWMSTELRIIFLARDISENNERAEQLKRNIQALNDAIQQNRNQLTDGGQNDRRIRRCIATRQRIQDELRQLNIERSILNQKLVDLVIQRDG